MRHTHRVLWGGFICAVLISCGNKQNPPGEKTANAKPVTKAAAAANDKEEEKTPASTTKMKGLMLAYSVFAQSATTQPALIEFIAPKDGDFETPESWTLDSSIEDPDSNVFHKAIYLRLKKEDVVISIGGMGAYVKKWWRDDGVWRSTTLWTEKFGGKIDRMRDIELVKVKGALIFGIATHDQGVVAILNVPCQDKTAITPETCRADFAQASHQRLDAKADTFVHEIEVGDIDADGAMEIYATPSDPNRLHAKQHGEVIRYDIKTGQRTIAADLGDRHAKEILVADVDGDGKDELYVSVEGATKRVGGKTKVIAPVQVLRFDADTPALARQVIAEIPGEHLSRFLTAGDVDGDGDKEIVAATFGSGLFLLSPGSDARAMWSSEIIDKDSGGFEHAAVLLDLDADGVDELYVASDNDKEVRRYVWKRGRPRRATIYRWPRGRKGLTWNLNAFGALRQH